MSAISSIFILIFPILFLIIAFGRIAKNRSFKIGYIHFKQALLSICFGLFLRCISDIVYNGSLIYYGWATIDNSNKPILHPAFIPACFFGIVFVVLLNRYNSKK